MTQNAPRPQPVSPADAGAGPSPTGPRPAPGPQPAAPAPEPVAPAARPARLRSRHWIVLTSFLIMVAAPVGVSSWYLWTVADDQYASTVAFSVRREEMSSAVELLGGITELSGSSSSDTDILYEFLQSQRLVAEMDEVVDLRGKWSKPDDDPVFAYDPSGSIEDLVDYWQRMVKVYYDSGAGLIEVRVLAFTPGDATRISTVLYDKSAEMINELSDIAREDSIRYARDELGNAVERLKEARQNLTQFRNRHQLVDPSVDLQTQAGLLGQLQTQLAEALIEMDLLSENINSSDPRMTQVRRRIEVIEKRIAAERRKLGMGSQTDSGEAMADVVGEYERLAVDLEFAETSYTSALASYDVARAEARRKSRYLAAHVEPTRAETSRYPERGLWVTLIALFLTLVWAIAVMVAWSLKDRR